MSELDILVTSPEETLEAEYKEWLDLRNKPHKAKLAKELIALHNHGGGHLVIGFEDSNLSSLPRPQNYDYVDTDYVNGIVARYADPPFHCRVSEVKGHIVIAVPAGAIVPIRSTRGSASDEIIQDRYYIRRPGPNSEPPQTALEWDELIRRCISNREAELEHLVRRILRAIHAISEDLPPDPSGEIESLLNE